MYCNYFKLSVFVLVFHFVAYIGCCQNVRNKRSNFQRRQQKQHRQQFSNQLMLAPALLLTAADSISLIYPKEMGYAKDFLHTIYKLDNRVANNETNQQSRRNLKPRLRIEDAVYDNRTWSIYFILSNSSAASSQIIRLTHLVPFYKQKIFNQKHLNDLKDFSSDQK